MSNDEQPVSGAFTFVKVIVAVLFLGLFVVVLIGGALGLAAAAGWFIGICALLELIALGYGFHRLIDSRQWRSLLPIVLTVLGVVGLLFGFCISVLDRWDR